MADERPIDVVEAQAQIELIQRALATDVEHERADVIALALLRFGHRFVAALGHAREIAEPAELQQAIAALEQASADTFQRWLGGDQLTDRADEDERRAVMAVDALRIAGPGLARLACNAVMRLPPGHALRDTAWVATKLRESAAWGVGERDWEHVVYTLGDLLYGDLCDEAQGEEVAAEILRIVDAELGPDDDESRRRGLRSVLGWHMTSAVAAREGATGRAPHHLAVGRPLIDRLRELGASDADTLVFALQLHEAGDDRAAADLLTPIVDRGETENASWLEGMLRVRLGDDERAIAVLEPLLPREEAEYLRAVSDEAIEELGTRFSKDAINLALAHARRGRFADALGAFERIKSLRLRHAAKLRRSPAGRRLLELEAELAAIDRGVAGTPGPATDLDRDPLGAQISRSAASLEAYRSARPELATTSLATPSIAEVAARLAPGEGIVCFGCTHSGLLMVLITAGDTDRPGAAVLLDDLPHAALVRLLFDDESSDELSGWVLELAASSPVDPERALALLLRKSDAALGRQLAALVQQHGLHALTIVPHRVLHLIPWWALPSLAGLDVRVAPSLAEWLDARGQLPTVAAKVLAVGNPTRDLPMAKIEASAVASLVRGRGCEVELLLDGKADEGAIRAAVPGCGVLHFAGHGLARPLQPLGSALLTHPDARWGWPLAGDPLALAAEQAGRWIERDDGSRYADVDAGRLIERLDDGGALVDRQLEHATRGSLWGAYEHGQLLQLAELWTTADILVEDALGACGLVFLAACDSGQGALRVGDVDEAQGLPGALRIAGAGVVVCALWPVYDVTSAVFAVLFYRRLAACEPGVVDVAALVRQARDELAALDRPATIAILETMRHGLDRASENELAHTIADVASGVDKPFADPFHWAAFATVGCERVELRWG